MRGFTRLKDEYYVVCQKEHVIDCRYAKGKASIPLIMINKIQIESPFEQIVKTIDYNDYTYRDIDTEENLEIVNDRISTTKRIANEKPESSSSSKRTSRRILQ